MDEKLLNEFKELNAWVAHVQEVKDFYRSEIEKFPAGSVEYEQWMQKLIEFMEESNLSSDERNWKLANMAGVDYIEIKKQAEIDVQKMIDEIERNKDKE